MIVYKVCTTVFQEEDFFLITDLTQEDITEVIQPMVWAERDGYEEYTHEKIQKALQKRYPKNKITMITDYEELIF
jgi:hypothetical protein